MKQILILGLMAVSAVSVSALPISPEEAWKNYEGSGKHKKAPLVSPRLLKTVNTIKGEPALYLFSGNNEKGFVLLSADDETTNLLGYSDENAVEGTDLSPEFEWWLECYSQQIAYLRENSRLSSLKTEGEPVWKDWEEIPPLLTTRWNQDAPYNDQCPEKAGKRCVTGCVATAMAQVMNYFEYPDVGTGLLSYSVSGIPGRLAIAFGQQPFDWDNMLDAYLPNHYNDEEASAVAYLMKACGYSVEMMYDPEASGAYAADIPNALTTYFSYSASVTYKRRDLFKYDDWSGMIYQNLKECGPVLYGGTSMEGGHEFVCDGYSGDGYFHFNWGWGGISDGYFLLDALNPLTQGIGGALGGFHFYQDIVLGIRPPEEGEVLREERLSLYGQFGATVMDDTLYVGYLTDSFIFPENATYLHFGLGMAVEDEEGNQTIYDLGNDFDNIVLEEGYMLMFNYDDTADNCPTLYLPDVDMEEGSEYRFTLMWKNLDSTDKLWQKIISYNGVADFFYVLKTESGYDVRNMEESYIDISSVDGPSVVTQGVPEDFILSLYNPGGAETSDILQLVLCDEEGIISFESGYFMQTLNGNEDTSLNLEITFNPVRDWVPDYSKEYELKMIDVTKWYLITPDHSFKVRVEKNEESSVSEYEIDTNYPKNIYSINGYLIKTITERKEFDELPSGLYIIDGKKIRKY